MFHPAITATAEQIMENPDYSISFEEACRLAEDSELRPVDLIACADAIRTHYQENRIFTCAIRNAKSGHCRENCAFCAQSAHHRTQIQTYPLLGEEELVQDALRMQAGGATHYSMVTSGFALTDEELDRICRAAETIGKQTDLDICASLGVLTKARARRLKDSGVVRYHHNLETGRSHFAEICTTHDYEDDLDTLRVARAAGLEVCSGGIMGLGESWAQRVELAFTLRELEVDSVPINFLNPISGTRMENRALLPPMEALRCIALFRFIHPRKDITVCGGRGVTLKDYQSWVFMAGANGLMIGDYLTTKGRSVEMDMAMIAAMGLEPRPHGIRHPAHRQ
jgi:biotin synthase